MWNTTNGIVRFAPAATLAMGCIDVVTVHLKSRFFGQRKEMPVSRKRVKTGDVGGFQCIKMGFEVGSKPNGIFREVLT